MFILLLGFCSFVGLLVYFIFGINSVSELLIRVKLYVKTKKFFVSAYKVDEESRRHGGELVAQVLKEHNVEFVFTLVGGHISPILVSCEANGIRVVDTRHEATAMFAADAVARLTQNVGVCAVTAGPGLTNTVTAVKNAQMAESPVLLLGGAAASILKGRGALQDIDQMALFRSLCKFCATVTRVQDIVPILRKAIQAARSGTPGPVFVEFPIDTLYPYQLIKREIGQKAEVKSIGDRIVNGYLENYLARLFGNAWEPKIATPLPLEIPMPKDVQVHEAVRLISNAERPIILFGSQAVLPPVKAGELKFAVEAMQIPCYLGGMSRGLLGRHGELHVRQERRTALKEADVVILAGCVCDFRLGYGRVLNRRSKIISINRSKAQLTKNSDMFWKPTIAMQADVGSSLLKISELLQSQGYKGKSDWLATLRDRDAKKEKLNEEQADLPTNIHLNPLKLLHVLEQNMSDDAILVADGGDFVGSAAYILRPRGPLKWLDPGAFGTLGVGGGFALGAKLCNPDKDVWVIYGDGSFGYSIAEFDTYKRHGTPILAMIGNDACWSQIAREQVPMFGSNVACGLDYCDYDKAVEGLGSKGVKLDTLNASSSAEIADLIKNAVRISRNGNSIAINALIGKTSFREGSISV